MRAGATVGEGVGGGGVAVAGTGVFVALDATTDGDAVDESAASCESLASAC
jgi:hypothetical protein